MTGGTKNVLGQAWWSLDELADAVEVIAQTQGLIPKGAAGLGDLDGPRPSPDMVGDWLGWAGDQLGLEILSVQSEVRSLGALIAQGGPALIMQAFDGVPGFLVLLRSRKSRAVLLGPDRQRLAIQAKALAALLEEPHAQPVRREVDRVLAAAAIPPRRRAKVAQAMISQRIGGETVRDVFLLRLPASSGFSRQLRDAGVFSRLLGIVAMFLLVYGGEIFGWKLIGGATLGGRLDWGWMIAWLLLMLSLLPARLLAAWNEALFSLETGRLMKSRLLTGALSLPVDTVRRSGVGQLISRVMEAQALDGLALGGGFAVLVGAVELTLAAWVLAQGAAPGLHLALLGLFTVATLTLTFGFHRAVSAWTARRLGMTHYLVEAMVGHRTRLAQERAWQRDAAEDSQLVGYFQNSQWMDQAALKLGSGLASAWQLAALLAFIPAVTARGAFPATALAISLGGILLAHRALHGIGSGLSTISRAGFAWKQVGTIFKAGARQPGTGLSPSARSGHRPRLAVLEARNLHFNYDRKASAVLDGVTLDIARGDRILVEGPSGGGKSTLASVLTGLRPADSGLLLLDGLDRPTIGDDWHRHVSAAPQFHENHILSGTMAFNLLMGRRWPPSEADLADAEEVCTELGLGDLLRRMPGGLNQRVGETGWQLSHGERSRVFLARALLQRAAVTILDESFASLDPGTMQQCLDTALHRSETLIVIAHP